MKKSEKVLGIIYIPIHAALLPLLLGIAFAIFGVELPMPHQLLVCFTLSFILVLLIMFRFLRASFSDMIDDFWRAVQAVILGYVFYRAMVWAAVLLMERIMTSVNPNTEVIVSEVASNFRVMVVVTAVLAPIIEEALFRGALYGTIRQKSRIAAYIVSTILFCAFHLWDHLLIDFSWDTLLMMIQYIPPSIALAWCYERGGTIWAPILLHAGLNLMASLQVRA